MKISIITAAYNSESTIGDTLRSVAMQTHPDIEHLVIDGGSTDNTLEIVRQSGQHVSHVVSERDRGIYDAMNKGISLATGDVIGFLNSDDVLADENVIATIASAMQDSRIDSCYGDLVYTGQYDMNKVVRYWKSRDYQHGLCAWGWMPAHPTFYVRKAIYQRYGGFDLDFKLQADFEMALRLFHVHQITSRYIPDIFVRMRVGGASNACLRNVIRGNLEAGRACRKHGLPGGIRFVSSKLLSRIPQFIRRP